MILPIWAQFLHQSNEKFEEKFKLFNFLKGNEYIQLIFDNNPDVVQKYLPFSNFSPLL